MAWTSLRTLSTNVWSIIEASGSSASETVRVTRWCSSSGSGSRGRRTPFSYTASTCLVVTGSYYDSFIPVAQRIWNPKEIRLIPMDFPALPNLSAKQHRPAARTQLLHQRINARAGENGAGLSIGPFPLVAVGQESAGYSSHLTLHTLLIRPSERLRRSAQRYGPLAQQ